MKLIKYLQLQTSFKVLLQILRSYMALILALVLLLQYYFCVNLNMHFLRRLFSVYKTQAPSKIQVELSSKTVTRQLPNPSGLIQQKQISQGSSFQNQLKSSLRPNQIQTKILHILPLQQKQLSWAPDFGTLVGVIGQQKYYQNIITSSHIVKVGRSQEISCLQSLRKNSLDSLVVFFAESGCQFDLETIILAEQNLVFVVEQWAVVKNLVNGLQKAIFDCFDDRPLQQSVQFLCLSIKQIGKRFIVEFKDGSFFLESFKKSLKKQKIQLQEFIQLQLLTKMIKLKDYLDFRQCKLPTVLKIADLASEIQREILNFNQKQEMNRITLLSTCQNQDDQLHIPQPVRKNSSMEADIEAEYFNKRVNQIHTVQMSINEIRDSSYLFYFIEQQDNDALDDSSQQSDEKYWAIKNKNLQKRIYRSKSEHAQLSKQEQELDEEFFSKY